MNKKEILKSLERNSQTNIFYTDGRFDYDGYVYFEEKFPGVEIFHRVEDLIYFCEKISLPLCDSLEAIEGRENTVLLNILEEEYYEFFQSLLEERGWTQVEKFKNLGSGNVNLIYRW
jgi:hypothetical protein